MSHWNIWLGFKFNWYWYTIEILPVNKTIFKSNLSVSSHIREGALYSKNWGLVSQQVRHDKAPCSTAINAEQRPDFLTSHHQRRCFHIDERFSDGGKIICKQSKNPCSCSIEKISYSIYNLSLSFSDLNQILFVLIVTLLPMCYMNNRIIMDAHILLRKRICQHKQDEYPVCFLRLDEIIMWE